MRSRVNTEPTPPLPCAEAQLWLSLKIDGEELPGDVGSRLEAHLACCRPCELWLHEETERWSRLRAYLEAGLDGQRELEEAIFRQAKRAGWDGKTLSFPRHGFRSRITSWRNSLVVIAAAALALTIAGMGGLDWLSPPRDRVATQSVEGTISPASLGHLIAPRDGESDVDPGDAGRMTGDFQVVPDADGRPVGVQFNRSMYRFRIHPQESDSPRNGLYLDLERIEPTAVRLTSWPYQ